MATERFNTESQSFKELPEWQQESIKMTHLVWENILDPLVTFTELVRHYGDGEDGSSKGPIAFNLQEISAVLRLLLIGAYQDPKMYCNWGGPLCHFSGYILDKEIYNWDGTSNGKGVEND